MAVFAKQIAWPSISSLLRPALVVKHEGRVVGRLYHTNSTPEHVSWFWSLLITPQPPDCRGHEPTKEEAMAAFRARWDLRERGE